MFQETSAGIIIYRRTKDGIKFLILYHGGNYWNFPKGKIELEEKSFQAAVREIREETGLTRSDLNFKHYFKAREKFVFWRNKEKIYKTVTFYLAETNRKAIKISEVTEGQPHEGFGWFTYNEATRVLTKNKDSLRILKQAYDYLRRQNFKNNSQNPQGPNPNLQRVGQISRPPQGVPGRGKHFKQKPRPQNPLPPRYPFQR